jgi:hypothetical protein
MYFSTEWRTGEPVARRSADEEERHGSTIVLAASSRSSSNSQLKQLFLGAPLCVRSNPRRKLGSVRDPSRKPLCVYDDYAYDSGNTRQVGKDGSQSWEDSLSRDPSGSLQSLRSAIREISRRPESSIRGLMGNPRLLGQEKHAASFRAPDKSSAANID